MRASRSGSHPGLWARRRHQPLGFRDYNPPPGVPLLRLWPRAVPIPVRSARDRRGGQSGAGAGDAPWHPAIRDPPLPPGSAQGLGVRPAASAAVQPQEGCVLGGPLRHRRPEGGGGPRGSAGYRGPWRQAHVLTLCPLTATLPVTGSKVLLVPAPVKQSREQTATPLKPPKLQHTAPRDASKAFSGSPLSVLKIRSPEISSAGEDRGRGLRL